MLDLKITLSYNLFRKYTNSIKYKIQNILLYNVSSISFSKSVLEMRIQFFCVNTLSLGPFIVCYVAYL